MKQQFKLDRAESYLLICNIKPSVNEHACQTCSQVLKVQVQVQVQVTKVTAYIRRNSETAAMLTSTYEALWFSIIILSIKSVNEILSFGQTDGS